MTYCPDPDITPGTAGKTARLPFESTAADLAGIRVTRAQFARLMNVSKQAVTDWVKSGRIIVGADDRFDPRHAVARLLATGDPAKLRAKVLAPLVADIAGRDRRIADLEAALADAQEEAQFHEGSADGFCSVFTALQCALRLEWSDLRAEPPAAGLAAVLGWLDEALSHGAGNAGDIADYLPGRRAIVRKAAADAGE